MNNIIVMPPLLFFIFISVNYLMKVKFESSWEILLKNLFVYFVMES